MIFNFNEIVFADMEGNPLTENEFVAIYRVDKNKLVANVLWRQCPSAEVASMCLDILKGNPTEVTKQLLMSFKNCVEYAIEAYPVRQPILDYIDDVLGKQSV